MIQDRQWPAFGLGLAVGIGLSTLALLITLALSSCRPAPAVRETEAVEPAPKACQGYRVSALDDGERLQLQVSRAGRLSTLDFVDGELEDPGGLASVARVERRGDRWCSVGELEGDPCLVRLWRRGECW